MADTTRRSYRIPEHQHTNPANGGVIGGTSIFAGGSGGTSSGGAGSVIASDVAIADLGGYFTATDVEAALAELALGGDNLEAHGTLGATETFDRASASVHSGTLDQDCTFTINAPTTTVALMEFWITQDGTGGWAITWPGSVTTDGTITPDTTAGVTVRYLLETIDGGTNWILDLVGGGGGATTLDDLTDVTITSAATADRLRYNGSIWVNSSLKWSPTTTYDGTNWLLVVDGSGNPVLAEV